MQRPPRQFDRDALLTLALTCLVLGATLALPWLAATAWVLVTGLRAGIGPGRAAILVIPGKRLCQDRPDADFRARLATAARLAALRADRRLLILGGLTGDGRLTEAEAGARWLREHTDGAAQLEIRLEQSSADTLTNLRHARALLKTGEGGNTIAPITVITNRYHLPRLGLMARSLGMVHELVAAEPGAQALRARWLLRWPLEGLFVCWFVTGRLYARLTHNRRMLARVS